MKIEIEPGVRLFVDIEGAGLVADGERMRRRPTLVLLHGGPGMDHTGFKPAMTALADTAQLVYYDHRGHGRSDPRPPDEWTLDRFADDVVALCDALGIDKPVVLGQSFGGMVAQRYLARHPRHPARVVLSSTSPTFGLERKLAVFERLGGAEARRIADDYWRRPDEAAWRAYERVCLPLYNPTPASPERMKRSTLSLDILNTWNARELPVMDLLPGLANAVCPVLVIGGEEDPVTPIDDQRAIAAALPAHLVEFHAFAGAGHGVWRDRPDDAMALLRRFVAAAGEGA